MADNKFEELGDCCATCRRMCELTQYDYSKGGCLHKEYDGYACLAFVEDGQVIHMIGNDPYKSICDKFLTMGNRTYNFIYRQHKKRKPYKKRKK